MPCAIACCGANVRASATATSPAVYSPQDDGNGEAALVTCEAAEDLARDVRAFARRHLHRHRRDLPNAGFRTRP